MRDVKRAIYLGILSYVLSFAVGLLVAKMLRINLTDIELVPTKIWVIGIVATIIIAAFFTMWYFKGTSIVPSAREGLHFGLVVFITSFILDLTLVLISMLLVGPSMNILAYYANALFWLTVLALLVTCMFVGMYLGKQPRQTVGVPKIREPVPQKVAVKKIPVKRRSAAKKTTKKKGKKRR